MQGDRPDAETVIEPGEESGHLWIQRASIVVDITADQFIGHGMPRVWVGESSWHDKLNGVPCRDALQDFDIPFYKQQTKIFDRLVATGVLFQSHPGCETDSTS